MMNLKKLKLILNGWGDIINDIKQEANELGANVVVSDLDKLIETIDNFYREKKRELHDDFKSGKKRECGVCEGKGYTIEKKTIPKRGYPIGLPDSGWVTEEIDDEIPCNNCNGKGYQELKWV